MNIVNRLGIIFSVCLLLALGVCAQLPLHSQNCPIPHRSNEQSAPLPHDATSHDGQASYLDKVEELPEFLMGDVHSSAFSDEPDTIEEVEFAEPPDDPNELMEVHDDLGIPMPVIPVVGDGDDELGFMWIDPNNQWASPSWYAFAMQTGTLWSETALRPREAANRFGCLWLHNPLTRTVPMKMQQHSIMLEHRAENPENERAQARSDINAFVHAMGLLTSCNIKLFIYVGGPEYLYPLHGETPELWADRAMWELSPYLRITPRITAIAFDVFTGFDRSFEKYHKLTRTQWHRQYSEVVVPGMQIVVKRIQGMGIKVYGEPLFRKTCPEQYRWTCGNILSDSFYTGRLLHNDWSISGDPCWQPDECRLPPIRFVTNAYKYTDAGREAVYENIKRAGHISAWRTYQLPLSLLED